MVLTMRNPSQDRLKKLIESAVNDGRNRNYNSAVKKLKEVIRNTDSCPSAILYLGRAYHELGRQDEAVMMFRMYINRMPKSDAGYFYLGRTFLSMDRYQRAARCFLEAVKLRDDFAPAHAYYGYASLRCGRFGRAVESLETAVSIDPDDSRIYSMYINSVLLSSIKDFRDENFDRAVQGFMFLEKAGFDSITTILHTGLALKELRHYAEASSYLEKAVEYSPDDVLIKDLLAEIYLKAGRVDDALSLLDSYLEPEQIKDFLGSIGNIDETLAVSNWNRQDYASALHFAIASLRENRSPDMHLLAGECLKNLGRLDDAYNHYCRAAEMDKRAAEPFYGIAIIFWLKKDYEGMLGIAEKISHKYPDDDFASYYIPLLKYKTGRPAPDWSDDIKALISRADGDDHWLLTAAGYGLLSEGNSAAALRNFNKAVRISADHLEAWEGLLSIISESGDGLKLINALTKYCRQFPGDTERHDSLIRLLIENEKYGKAVSELTKSVTGRTAGTGRLRALAYCLRMDGKFGEAAIFYRQLLRDDPYNENCLKLLLYCMRKSGDDAGTIPLMREALKVFPKPSLELLIVYGSALYRADLDEEALNVFQKCLYEGYKDWRVFRNMGIIYKNRGMKEWSEMYLRKSDELKK